MASSSSSPSDQQDHHHRTRDDSGYPRHGRQHIDHLQVQVPTAIPNNNSTTPSCFTGCFRPSPSTSPSPTAYHHHVNAHGYADRPASPSLIRSPTAWIRSLGSGKHTRRRSRDFQYDATSYARNFDEGGTEGESDEDARIAAGDAVNKYRLFSSRLPTSPPALSPSGLGPAGNGRGTEPEGQSGRD